MIRINRILLSIVFLSLLTVGVGVAQEPDVEGSKDYPLFNRMPGYLIYRYTDTEFDSHTFYDANHKELKVEGHVYEIRYSLQSGAKEPSRIQIFRNYENAVTKIGGTVLSEDDEGNSYMKLVKEGKEIWVHVAAYITSEWMLYIVEKEAMKQDIVANGEVFSNNIKTTGHAPVYGIYFDFNKSEIKPESDSALSEIAKLLKGEPTLKVNVVGHTDNVGTMESNMKLSLARAEAVVRALVTKHGIAADRLKGYGVGPLAPVASNDSEEGKAKNRRVELVKQ